MRYWLLVLAISLLGFSSAKADYIILRVILNNEAPPPMGMTGGMGAMGGFPVPPGGMGGFPVPPGGMAGIPGGMGGNRGGMGPPPGMGFMGMGPPPGMGGGQLGNGGNRGGASGPPPGMGFGGVPPGGFGGVPPGGMGGMGGGMANGFMGAAQASYRLGPDDYVTAIVEIKDGSLQSINQGRIYHRENIGIPGHFSFVTKYGTSFVDANQGEIILDFKRLHGPMRQLEDRKKAMKDTSPEKYLELADWCLSVGLPEECRKILDYLTTTYGGRPELKAHPKAVLAAYAKVKDIITANIEANAKAEDWKTRLRMPALSVSKHYAIVHSDSPQAQESATSRLEHLEMNFKTFYLWFALRGRALPGPNEKLTAVIVSESREFRSYRDTFEATNLVVDGFHARRENLAIFSLHRLDKASVSFQQTINNVYKQNNPDDLFKPKLPDLKANPNAPKFRDLARSSMLALVDKALRDEAEIAACTHEGTKQLFAETGLLPRNVLAPEWLRFGTASLFEMPKGPFPGGAGQVKVAFYPGGGGPSWSYMRYFEEMKEKGLLADSARTFINTVLDRDFQLAAETARRTLDQKRRGEEGDSKATQAEVLAERARTLSWALCFYLARDKFAEFEAFLQELAKLPRDAELDSMAVAKAFAKAFRLDSAALDGDYFDPKKFTFIGQEWMNFMGRQQSPSRNMKLDDLAFTATPAGMGMGMGPGGFPGGGPGGTPGGGPGGGAGGGAPPP